MITLEQKNKYLRHMAAVLRKINEQYKPSDKCVHVEVGSEFFEDSCNFVGLHHEIFKLIETLDNMYKYNNWILEEEKK